MEILRAHRVDLVCLAGFMRLLSPVFVRAFPGRIVNIHPALLPAFPGLDAQRQAWEHGAKVSGATVHLVDEGLDSGPIVAQEAVPVLSSDTPRRSPRASSRPSTGSTRGRCASSSRAATASRAAA